MRSVLILGLCVAACLPTDVADKVGRRAAETVVLPVVAQYLPGQAADATTRCIIENASANDIQSLIRDVGTVAGTSTVATVLGIAARPETAACIAGAVLPQTAG